MFIQSVEIGENRGMFSTVGVKALDVSTGEWQTIYSGEANEDQWSWMKSTQQYNKFKPPICQPAFASSVVRIELDTYAISDWNEIDYVRVVGATELRAGVLKADAASQTSRVVYVPDANFNGDDSFAFKACDCAYDSARASEKTMVSIAVGPVNDAPVAKSTWAEIACSPGVSDNITLRAADLDAGAMNSSAALTFSVVSLPPNATLYDGDGTLITPDMLPAALPGSSVDLMATYSGVSDPPSGFEFRFIATDEAGATSAPVSVTTTCTATKCEAGHYFDRTALACAGCPAGTFASEMKIRSSCEDCASGKFSPEPGSHSFCGSCPNGQVAVERGSMACADCPSGAKCEDTNSVTVRPGWWSTKPQSFEIYECPFGAQACMGGNTTRSCGHGYGGVLCGVCQPGYVQTGDRCSGCNSLPAPIVAIIVITTATVIALTVWYLTCTNNRFAAAMESISLTVPFKIYFATCQVTCSPVCVYLRMRISAVHCNLSDPRCIRNFALGRALPTAQGLSRKSDFCY